MAGPTQTTPLGLQDSTGVRATSVVSPNQRVRASSGFLGTVADQPTFPVPPGPSVIGRWLVPDARTLACGVPTISTSAVGLTVSPPTSIIGPMLVVQPDTRVRSS